MIGAAGVQAYVGWGSGGSGGSEKVAASEGPVGGPGPAMGILPGEHGGTTPPGQSGELGAESQEGEEPVDVWSPAIFRMGFSFFAGFAIAYALRMFVKVSVISIGIFLLAMFGLQYAGFIEVNWTMVGERYETFSAWFGDQFKDFSTFVTGYLPSAATGTGGLAIGFMKK
jgi:uncharacterized membrane protein (Fun14 family)